METVTADLGLTGERDVAPTTLSIWLRPGRTDDDARRRARRAGALASRPSRASSLLVGLVAVGAVPDLRRSSRARVVSHLRRGRLRCLVDAATRNVIGWILLGLAAGWVANTSYPAIDVDALVRGDAPVRDTAIAWLNGWSGRAVFLGFLALTIVFPGGHLAIGRGRRIDILLLAIGGAVPGHAVRADPDRGPDRFDRHRRDRQPRGSPAGTADVWASLLELGDLVYIALLGVGVGRSLLRSPAARGIERLQFHWLVAAFAVDPGGDRVRTRHDGRSSGTTSGRRPGSGVHRLLDDPARHRHRGPALPAVRDRPDRQPDDRVRHRHRPAGGAFRGDRRRPVDRARPGRQGQTIAVAASTLVVFALFQPVLRRVPSGASTGGSTGPATTPSARSTRSRAGSATRSTCRPCATTSSARPSRRGSPCASGVWLRPTSRRQPIADASVTIPGRPSMRMTAT